MIRKTFQVIFFLSLFCFFLLPGVVSAWEEYIGCGTTLGPYDCSGPPKREMYCTFDDSTGYLLSCECRDECGATPCDGTPTSCGQPDHCQDCTEDECQGGYKYTSKCISYSCVYENPVCTNTCCKEYKSSGICIIGVCQVVNIPGDLECFSGRDGCFDGNCQSCNTPARYCGPDPNNALGYCCYVDILVGDSCTNDDTDQPGTCDASGECSAASITCGPTDGICPSGCTNPPDPDCPVAPPSCGPNDGNCPSGCTNPPDPDCPTSSTCTYDAGCGAINLWCRTDACIPCDSGYANCDLVESCECDLGAGNTCQAGVCVGGGNGGGGGSGGITIENPLSSKTFNELLKNITNFIFWIGMALAPVMLVISGFLFVTSGGNSQRVTTAKNIALYTIIGLVIILLASGLIKVLQSLLGG